MKQQFNIYLDPGLVGRIKHRAIDESLSLSSLVTRVFERYLDHFDREAGMRLEPLVHVSDMNASIAFYEALGATVIMRSRDNDFAQVQLGESRFSLLAHPPNPEQSEDRVELNFTADRPLHEIERDLRAAGVSIVRPASDEAFGEQLQIESPDGLLLKINRLEPETFA